MLRPTRVAAINAEHCRQCGTPPQLEEFMAEVAAGQAPRS